MLRDKVHGPRILEVRKALAFAGFTHKSPRAITYVKADRAFGDPLVDDQEGRGRSMFRGSHEVGRARAMSL